MVATTNTSGYWIHNLENVLQPADLTNILTAEFSWAVNLAVEWEIYLFFEDPFILITSHVVRHQIKMLFADLWTPSNTSYRVENIYNFWQLFTGKVIDTFLKIYFKTLNF